MTLDATLQVLDGVVYHFVGAIIHLGDYMHSGHYVTVVKCADGLLRYFSDDDEPEILTWSDVNERFDRDAFLVAYQRGPTSVAPIAAPGRGPPRRTPTLTQWGHEEDTDEEEVSDLEEDYASSGDESESEDEAERTDISFTVNPDDFIDTDDKQHYLLVLNDRGGTTLLGRQ